MEMVEMVDIRDSDTDGLRDRKGKGKSKEIDRAEQEFLLERIQQERADAEFAASIYREELMVHQQQSRHHVESSHSSLTVMDQIALGPVGIVRRPRRLPDRHVAETLTAASILLPACTAQLTLLVYAPSVAIVSFDAAGKTYLSMVLAGDVLKCLIAILLSALLLQSWRLRAPIPGASEDVGSTLIDRVMIKVDRLIIGFFLLEAISFVLVLALSVLTAIMLYKRRSKHDDGDHIQFLVVTLVADAICIFAQFFALPFLASLVKVWPRYFSGDASASKEASGEIEKTAHPLLDSSGKPAPETESMFP
eukprot:NODE_2705_length_1138_cov_77.260790_g2483_i0.p1 GENE.NODE_2705_length_1138_cov_77.260790_g2483_i0~~NODE_2705_length_1138_cov_77.260790_g2483_i0.p1  ORF type:complete len:307 (-),score=47.56 NODE_2705_length_1138_cov_77.260790_g2483_i0:56-976(-)